MKIITSIAIIIALLIIVEAKMVYIDRAKRRAKIFALAHDKASSSGKPLVVIGDPATANYSLTDFDYGCGDLCIDIANCPRCSTSIAYNIDNGFEQLADNSCVVFVSCTLEYVDDIYSVFNSLMRISGGDLYVVAIEPYSLKTLFAPNLGYGNFSRKWRILKAPPNGGVLIAEKINGNKWK